MKHDNGKVMNVVTILDDNYLDYAKVMINSLFYHHSNRYVVIYIFSSALNEQSRGVLNAIADKYNGRIEVIDIDASMTASLPKIGRWPRSVWNSVLIPYYIPENVDKAVYLDIDMVINASFEKVYDTDFGDYAMYVCQDKFVCKHRKGIGYRLGINKDIKYFNLGFNIMNIPKLKQLFPSTIEAVQELINKHGDKMEFPDQDIYNIICHEDVRYLNADRYNYIRDVTVPLKHSLEYIEKNVVVLHYASDKPLSIEIIDIYGALFWKYAIKFGVAKELYTNMKAEYLANHSKAEYYAELKKAIYRIGLKRNNKSDIKALYERASVNNNAYDKLMILATQEGKFEEYMKLHGFTSIAVYGGGALGKRLTDYILKSGYSVECIIDKKLTGEYKGIPYVENLNKDVDVVIISVEYYYDEIEKELSSYSKAYVTGISKMGYEVG